MTEKPRRKSFEEAAEQCGVSVSELKLWLIENTNAGPQRWSKWRAGVEPIPERHLVAFLRAKVQQAAVHDEERPAEIPLSKDGRGKRSVGHPPGG